MPDLMLLGIEEQVLELEPDENPGQVFPCLPCEGIHSELRAQLYAQLMGIFFDEAESLEQLTLEFDRMVLTFSNWTSPSSITSLNSRKTILIPSAQPRIAPILLS